ncbi:histone-lysine N-methyltransferase trithorax [Schistocerca serialis cubense]|uniref:histone-lysine N-methyltransferase trithorax n=1 Tax=Schistocerca serialis cubense TaxID=2023355 RepID=UPI00214F49B8|nr:histone-lysine N-methyltransferase trithorax [Schistocerca serialis cubense]
MGKFPGKPSKTSTRKRIKVSECVTELVNESVRAAQVIYYGLTVFNETFGNEEQVIDFRGFTHQQVKEAVENARNFHKRRKSTDGENKDTANFINKFESDLKEIGFSAKCCDGQGKSDSDSIVVDSEKCFDGGGKRNSVIAVRRMKRMRKYDGRTRNPPSVKNVMARKLLRRAKKTSSTTPLAVDNCQQEKGASGASRKFVLPSHSAHSSRVIKPNKKFIDNDAVTSETSTGLSPPVDLKKSKSVSSESLNSDIPQSVKCLSTVENKQSDSSDVKKTLCNLRTANVRRESASGNTVDSSGLILEGKRKWKPSYKLGLQLNWYGGTADGDDIGRRRVKQDDKTESSARCPEKTTSPSSTTISASVADFEIRSDEKQSSTFPRSPGKVILRQARLKLNTQSSSVNDGPFSHGYGAGGAHLPETVECGVCGAVRFYRFVKQARKFGIFSCESCRKFISKMIKRQSSLKGSTSPLECHKGKGMCSVPPIVRSQQWKAGRGTLVRCNYKARCPACWLKMCLRSFKMPEDIRGRLQSLLPRAMQDSLETISGQLLLNPEETALPIAERRSESDYSSKRLRRRLKLQHKQTLRLLRKDDNGKQNGNTKLNTSVTHSRNSIRVSKFLRRAASGLNHTEDAAGDTNRKVITRKRKRRKYLLRRKKSETTNEKISSEKSAPEQRQRVDLKGPRVKHVCRSASIVLGQPQATFPTIKTSGQSKKRDAAKGLGVPPHHPELPATEDDGRKSNEIQKNQPTAKSGVEESDSTKSSTHGSSGIQVDAHSLLSSTSCRKVTRLHTLPPAMGKDRSQESSHQMTIDFWESYDPDEVCNTGFALIASEPFPVRAVCFLCGSAGQEQLIHCASCCEPYHRFCLEDGLRDPNIKAFGGTSLSNWVCQRCTVCSVCGNGQGQQLSCQRCHRTYHTDCLSGRRLHSADRPWVCSTCLRCKSCGTENVTNFVGNIPLCKACFKLRQKGNYCPLCQRCYEDHDYDTKMMECVKCNCWVHSRCEGLSDEKYHILSYLPDTVEFICRKCCEKPPAPWWYAVEEEMKAGYLTVLKLLSKNRKAYSMLRCSPKKHCEYHPNLIDDDNINTHSDPTAIGNMCLGEKTDSNCEDNTFLSITDLHVENVEYSVEVKTTYEVDDDNNEFLADSKRDNICARDQRLSNREYNLHNSCSDEKCFPHSQGQTVVPYLSENSLRLWREKYNLKECSVRVKDCVSKDLQNSLFPVKVDVQCTELSDTSAYDTTKSPSKVHQVSLATPTSDSGISSTDEELKICGGNDAEELKEHALSCLGFVASSRLLSLEQCSSSRSFENFTEASSKKLCSDDIPKDEFLECNCLENLKHKSSLTFLSVKNKVNSSEYTSVLQFHQEMEDILNKSHCSDLLQLYYHNMQEVFPWFNPKFARVSNNPVCERNSQPSKRRRIISEKSSSDDHNSSMEVSILDDSFHAVPDKMLGKSLDDFYSGYSVQDNRVCVLCKGVGDGLPAEEGRLLYCGQNEWAHTNCALWSAEVFEEIDGSLQNVHSAMSRGRQIRCDHCGKRGASVGCCTRNCPETFHFPCARKVNCTFMDDKNVFCPSHAKGATGKVLHNESDFEICRPIYVELDRKKKKFAEPKKVRLMIGSLSVENIGEFVSEVSDTPEAIIPNGFSCTRLFWSSIEPWRIVRYHIKTVLCNKNVPQSPDCGKNMTVDHSQERHVVEEKLNEISKWRHEIKTNDSKNLKDNSKLSSKINQKKFSKFKRRIPYRKYQNKRKCHSLDDKIVYQVVNYMLDIVSSKDVDENSLHDSQNAADLLPPELKEAIFEDLPHDLIDGISMQDILPKLMVYEEMGAMEKSDGFYGNDPSVTEKEISSTDEANLINNHHMGNTKKPGFLEVSVQDQDDLCHKSTLSKQKSAENAGLSKNKVKRTKRMKLRRTKHNNVVDITSDEPPKRRKRACSTTWNSKPDGNYSSAYKRRKLSHTVGRSVRENPFVVIVDSDASHTLQELRLPECGHVTLSRSPPSGVSSTATESPAELKCGVDEESPSDSSKGKVTLTKEEGKENKFLPWNGRPQTRFLQLDGTVDPLSSSGSEGGRSPRSDDEKLSDCAYEASSSSLRSCGNCQRCSSDFNSGGNFGAVCNCSSSSSQAHGKSWYKTYDTEEEPVRCTQCRCTYRTKKSFERHLSTCCNNFMLSTSESDSENTRSSEEECTKRQQFDTTETCCNVGENVLGETDATDLSMRSESVECSAAPPQNSPVLERLKLKSSSKFEVESNVVDGVSTHTSIVDTDLHYQQHLCQGNSYVQVQSSQHSNAPAVIMQQVPSPSVVPTFIEAFQQQTGQNLQLVATIDTHTNGYNKQQFVSANPLVSGNYPVQAPESFVRLPLVPNVQSPAPHSAFLGTVLPPTQQNAVHCVSAEQTMIGCTPSMDMYGTQPGGMYLAGQPMYISNYETVVSNTVMSSSQLVSAALPGVVAASSSFSATTTQVFQASKLGPVIELTLEPVVEVQPSYLIINQQTPISNSPVRNTEYVNCPPSTVSMQVPSYDHSFLPVQQVCTEDQAVQYPESSSTCTSVTLKTVMRSENRRRTIPEMTKIVTPRCASTSVDVAPEMSSVVTPRCVNSGGHTCFEMSKVMTPRCVSNNGSPISEFPKIMTPRRVSSSVGTDHEFPKIMTPRRVSNSVSTDHEFPKIMTPRRVSNSVSTDHEFPKIMTPRCVSSSVSTDHEFPKIMTPRCVSNSVSTDQEFPKIMTPRRVGSSVSTDHEFPKIMTPRRVSSSVSTDHEFPKIMAPRCVGSSVSINPEFPKIVTPKCVSTGVNTSFDMSNDTKPEFPKIMTPRCASTKPEFPKIMTPRCVSTNSEFPKIITPRRVSNFVNADSEFPKIMTPRRVSNFVNADSEFPKIMTPRRVSNFVNADSEFPKIMTPRRVSNFVNADSEFPKIMTPRRVSNFVNADSEFPKIMTPRRVSNFVNADSEFPKIMTPRRVSNFVNADSEFPKIMTPRRVSTGVNTPYDKTKIMNPRLGAHTRFEMARIITPRCVTSGVNTSPPASPVRNACDKCSGKSQSDREDCLIQAEQQLSENSGHQIFCTCLQSNTTILTKRAESVSTRKKNQICCSCVYCYAFDVCCACKKRCEAAIGGQVLTHVVTEDGALSFNQKSSDIPAHLTNNPSELWVINREPDHSLEVSTEYNEPKCIANLPNRAISYNHNPSSKDQLCNNDTSTFNTSAPTVISRRPGHKVTESPCKRETLSHGKYKRLATRQTSPVNDNSVEEPDKEGNGRSVLHITDAIPPSKTAVNRHNNIKVKASNLSDKLSSSKPILQKQGKFSTSLTNDESRILKLQNVKFVDVMESDTFAEAVHLNRDEEEDIECTSGISLDRSPKRKPSSECNTSVSSPQYDEQNVAQLHTQTNCPEERKSFFTCNTVPQVNADVSVYSSDTEKERAASPLPKDDCDGSSCGGGGGSGGCGGGGGRSATNNGGNYMDVSDEDNAGDAYSRFGAHSDCNTGGSIEKDSRPDIRDLTTEKNVDDSGTNGYNDEEDDDTECCEDDDEEEEEENGDNDCDEGDEDENEDDSGDEDDNGGDDSRDTSPVYCNGENSEEKSSYIMYEICSQDGFCCTSKSFSEAWQKVFDAVQNARIVNKMPPLPQNPFSLTQKSLQILGLKHNAVRYLVEQLPGVGRCVKYKPRYHKQRTSRPEDDLDTLPPPNKSGCIRTEPFKSRRPYDMFSWLASSHRNPPKFVQQNDSELMSNRRATSSNLPMAMRFRHLKGTNPNKAVGVYQSHIHGRGLFCLRDIESGEMVIEYAGEVIRSTLTDKREKLYESKGIGCYMFRIDDQLVVDATMRGNAARFINHSCDPNCYSRVVDILGKKHILIFALRRIPQGEELTYDYKFPFEDVKIPCTCGSRKCRKYLN